MKNVCSFPGKQFSKKVSEKNELGDGKPRKIAYHHLQTRR